jgi:phosphoglucosamine mutase
MSQAKRQFFGTDGVRGVANRHPMTPEFVMKLGRAAALVLGGGVKADGSRPRAVIGRDTRASGEMLEMAMAAGLASAGVDAEMGGVLPTPAVAVLAATTGADFGVIVSASHNPFKDNGIKFVLGSGHKLDDAIEAQIEHYVIHAEDPTLPRPEGEGVGRIRHLENAEEAFVQQALRSMEGVRLDGMKVAVDNAHGACYAISEKVLTSLGAEVTTYFAQPDGFNINRDCGCTHSHDIEELVKSTGVDVGLAFDGDADRILMIDESGSALDGDEFMAIAADAMLRAGKLNQKTLAVTIMSNYGLDDLVASHGGKVIRTGVGDRYVLEVMRRDGLNFGGEQSGHIIFGDYATTGDGLISGLQLLKIMRETGQPLSQLRQCLKKFPQAARNLYVKSKPPLAELTETMKIVAETEATLGSAGRVLLRYSGTESLIRVLLEGKDGAYLEAQAEKIAAAIMAQIG